MISPTHSSFTHTARRARQDGRSTCRVLPNCAAGYNRTPVVSCTIDRSGDPQPCVEKPCIWHRLVGWVLDDDRPPGSLSPEAAVHVYVCRRGSVIILEAALLHFFPSLLTGRSLVIVVLFHQASFLPSRPAFQPFFFFFLLLPPLTPASTSIHHCKSMSPQEDQQR